MSISVIINGAEGRMGQVTVAAISADPDLNLVAKLGHLDDLSAAIQETKADVVIDFTTADSAFKNTQTIIAAKARPVIGTSGLIDTDVAILQEQCAKEKLGGLIAPNFSIAAVLMMKYAADAAQYLPNVEIIEMHHDGKADSPSGTAIKTAEMIAANQKNNIPPARDKRETIPGARGATCHQIPIHAIRLPGFVAHQEVIFGAKGETLNLCHNSINRECFMPGVLLACKKVMGLDGLVYGLENIL